MKKSLLLTAAALTLTAFGAHAQAAAPTSPVAAPSVSTPPPPPTFGSAVPGQCVLDVSTAMASSQLGKAAAARLQQLGAVVQSELSTDDSSLSTEYKGLQDSQKTATTATAKAAWDAKEQAFEQKYQDFQKKQQQRSQEMQYTQQSVMSWIFTQMIVPINQVVTARGCSTVINSDSLLHYSQPDSNGQTQADFLYTNPAMNITSDVVAKLDAANITLPQIDRANLDQQQGAAPAGGQ